MARLDKGRVLYISALPCFDTQSFHPLNLITNWFSHCFDLCRSKRRRSADKVQVVLQNVCEASVNFIMVLLIVGILPCLLSEKHVTTKRMEIILRMFPERDSGILPGKLYRQSLNRRAADLLTLMNALLNMIGMSCSRSLIQT